MVVAVDFDHTLQDNDARPPGKHLGPPQPRAVEALRVFRAKGFYIVIHSCRANEGQRSIEVMRKWLDYFEIPYDTVWGESPSDKGKPVADLYIDDKAYRFTSWGQVLHDLGLDEETDESSPSEA